MILEKQDRSSAVFSIPLSDPDTLPRRTMLLRVCSLECRAVRITRTLRPEFLTDHSDTVIPPAPAPLRVSDAGDSFLADCGGVMLRIGKRNGNITFLDGNGRPLLREQENTPCVMEEKPVLINRFREDGRITCTRSVDGIRASGGEYEVLEDRKAYACRLNFTFDDSEGLYGLGSHEEGFGCLRGKSRDLYQHNMKAVVPVLLSTRGWGLLFDMGCLMAFHDDPTGSCLWADCADEMDYYFFSGGYPSVCRQYADLTGHAPLLPRYAFGFIQSKERYHDAEELLRVVKEYRRRRVPLDMIVLDWQSWPEGQWGWKVFDPARFPDPAGLTKELHRLGARLMISIWPSMQGDRNENRAEMLRNGCMLGNRTIYNAFDEKARALYWKQAEEGLFRFGVDAWWCDCSEPFEADWHGAVKPEPFERTILNTAEAKKYLDPGRISLYSLYHSMGIWQGQRSATNQKRVLNLTRSSWAGQHRYATVTWSGDVSASWEVLRRQVPEGLNFMAAGEGWWTTDAGGFFPMRSSDAWFMDGDFNDGVLDPGYRELFVRWMQFAAFLPLMRAHGTGTPREIWQFGEKGSLWYDALEKTIRLRSRLVPYLYSLAAEYARTGLPPVRIPALMYPKDETARQVSGEMLLGCLLVKPVVHPMMYLPEGKPIHPVNDTEEVYLPAGPCWYDWRNGAKYAGGQTVTVHAPLDSIPVFVPEGSILITGPELQHVDECPDPPLDVTVFPGDDGTCTWYNDAGDGYGYEAGESALVTFEWDDSARILTVSAREGSWPGMSRTQELHIRLFGGKEHMIRYAGDRIGISLSAD